MYQKSILKTIIISGAAFKEVQYIVEKIEYIFDDDGCKDLFMVIKNFWDQYGSLPDKNWIESYFDHVKDRKAKTIFPTIISDDISILENLRSYLDLQINYLAKKKCEISLRQYENEIKKANIEEIPELIKKLNDSTASVVRDLTGEDNKRQTLYGNETMLNVLDHYKKVKDRGVFISKYDLLPIDENAGGLKKDDFITIAAFVAQGKSMMSRFLTYKQLMQGKNVYFQTLEMSLESIRNHFFVLHANNTKIWGWGSPKITYKKLKAGNLTPEEEDFLFKQVVPDFMSNKQYGSLHLAQPNSARYSITDTYNDIRAVKKTQMPIEVWVCDYLTLIRPTRRGSVGREDYNEMIADVRQFTLSEDICFITAAQTNRDGFRDALKSKELQYGLSCTSDYNALERSSTMILTILQNEDLRKAGLAQIQNLKNREDELFPYFRVVFDGHTGWYYVTQDITNPTEILDIVGSIEI